MAYTVWVDYGSEGWKPSDDLDTLEDCFEWLRAYNSGNHYRITKSVAVEFIESETPD
jgi:hypothetical protein